MLCPLCGGTSSRMFEARGYGVRDCAACGHRFAELTPSGSHLETVYGDSYFHDGGSGYTDYLAESDLLRRHGRRYGELAARHATPGRMLDVGAAAGFVLQGYQDAGWTGRGLEPNPAMARHAREVLGLQVDCGSAETLDAVECFDLVSMVQVVAHLTDVRGALHRLERATCPGGLWLIETWDRTSWTARIAGSSWHEYSPPSVLHWFTRQSLQALVAEFGFETLAVGRPTKRLSGAHAKSLMAHAYQGRALWPLLRAGLRAVPDGAVLPYPAEDLFWLICRKPFGPRQAATATPASSR